MSAETQIINKLLTKSASQNEYGTGSDVWNGGYQSGVIFAVNTILSLLSSDETRETLVNGITVESEPQGEPHPEFKNLRENDLIKLDEDNCTTVIRAHQNPDGSWYTGIDEDDIFVYANGVTVPWVDSWQRVTDPEPTEPGLYMTQQNLALVLDTGDDEGAYIRVDGKPISTDGFKYCDWAELHRDLPADAFPLIPAKAVPVKES